MRNPNGLRSRNVKPVMPQKGYREEQEDEEDEDKDIKKFNDPISENVVRMIGLFQIIAGSTLILTGMISTHATQNQLVGIISFLSGGSSLLAGILELHYAKSACDTVIAKGSKTPKEARRKLALFMFKSFTILIICLLLSVINCVVIYRPDLLEWT